MTAPPTPPVRSRRRRRRRRIRIALQLAIGGAALWFVLHPSALPTLQRPDTAPDSTGADSLDADSTAGDTAAVSVPLDRLPATGIAPRLVPKGRLFRSIEERARAGERIAVSVTAYCLDGRTRRGTSVREGIIAVDRTLFPLGRSVDIWFGRRKHGRFLAEDTGGAIRGARIDIWMSDCGAARRFGRRRGYAQLVPRGE